MNVNESTSYWIYILGLNTYTEYSKTNTQHITFLQQYDLKINDITVIYCKDKTQGGFKEVIKLGSSCTKNQNKKPINMNIF